VTSSGRETSGAAQGRSLARKRACVCSSSGSKRVALCSTFRAIRWRPLARTCSQGSNGHDEWAKPESTQKDDEIERGEGRQRERHDVDTEL